MSGKKKAAMGLALRVDEDAPTYERHRPMVEALLAWFARAKRPLPWRRRYEPYAVWVSEVMLQQTRMERAVEYFERWMRRFPNLESLAGADEEAVLKAWEGLGYYNRARNMLQCARTLLREHGGDFPRDFKSLRALPGIGEYTAGAILSIAYNLPFPAVDANVERLFSRLFDISAPVKSRASSGFIRHLAEALMPPGRARDFNEALMEFGALVCGKKARCEVCPLQGFCQARRLGIIHERPVPGKRAGYTELVIVSGVLLHQGRVFVQKRLDSGVWAGFWEFPGGRLEAGESPEQALCREFAEETEFAVKPLEYLGLVRHGYTRYTVSMHCFLCALRQKPKNAFPAPVLHAATAYRWLAPGQLEELPLPAGHRKLLDAWRSKIDSRC